MIFKRKISTPPPIEPNPQNDHYKMKHITISCFIAVVLILAITITKFVKLFVLIHLVRILIIFVVTMFGVMLLIHSNSRMYDYVKRQLLPIIIFQKSPIEAKPTNVKKNVEQSHVVQIDHPPIPLRDISSQPIQIPIISNLQHPSKSLRSGIFVPQSKDLPNVYM